MPPISTHYPKAGAQPTANAYAKQIDTNLVAAGWERVWVNPNAIGTGTAANPQFNTVSYLANTTFGIIHYRMPVSGGLPRWIWAIDYQYGSGNNTYFRLSITLATDADGAGGLTSPGVARVNATGQLNNSNDHGISADEHELFVGWGNGARVLLGRGRTLQNVRIGDAVLLNGAPGIVHSVRRNWILPEYALANAIFEVAPYNTSSFDVPASNATADNNESYPIGPYSRSGGRLGLPRLWNEACSGDAPAGLDQTYTIDGVAALYTALDAPGTMGLNSRTLMARS